VSFLPRLHSKCQSPFLHSNYQKIQVWATASFRTLNSLSFRYHLRILLSQLALKCPISTYWVVGFASVSYHTWDQFQLFSTHLRKKISIVYSHIGTTVKKGLLTAKVPHYCWMDF
jgi:hypothetical protein